MENNITKKLVLIVDDDAKARRVLAERLQKYDWVEVVAEAEGVADTFSSTARLQPDLIFLDVELHDQSAIDFLPDLKLVLKPGCRIVFYSTYSKYIMQALRSEAFDFLLKPIDDAELDLIMNRYMTASSELTPTPAASERLDMDAKHPGVPIGISVTSVTNDRIILFPKDIVFFRYDAARKLWTAVLATMKHIVLKKNTKAETILNYGRQFVRTHKGFIVNIGYVAMISNNTCRLLPPYDKITDIKISKSFRTQLFNSFYDL